MARQPPEGEVFRCHDSTVTPASRFRDRIIGSLGMEAIAEPAQRDEKPRAVQRQLEVSWEIRHLVVDDADGSHRSPSPRPASSNCVRER